MSLPTISGTARLTAAPEMRFAPSGVAVCKIPLAFNSRKRQDDGTWVDDRTFFVTGVLFKQAAENVAEALDKGHEVVVTGRLATDQWEDKNGGGKRSAPSLLIDSIGPAISQFQTARVSKLDRTGGSSGQQGGGQRPAAAKADDPWSSSAPTTSSPTRGSFDDEPPF